MDRLQIIVGLGNPGREYADTRHNAGYLALDQLGARVGAVWKAERKFESQVARWSRPALGDVLLCKPQTFMNASGKAVGALMKFYQVTAAACLIVVDDADLPLGEVRMRPHGGTGGHHGLESIEQHLGTKLFPRLRIGIGRRDERREITGHVLGKFSAAEADVLDQVLRRTVDQMECWVAEGISKAMSQFNGTITGPNNEGKVQ